MQTRARWRGAGRSLYPGWSADPFGTVKKAYEGSLERAIESMTMANPIVEHKTEDGDVRSKLQPGNLEPDEAFPLKLLRVSHPYEGDYGPYLFAQVQTPDGNEHTITVGHNVKAPGFLDEGETTAFEQAYEERFGEPPERATPGRSLADCFYEAPLDSDETRLVRQTGETEDGAEFNLYHFGVPESEASLQGGIDWRE